MMSTICVNDVQFYRTILISEKFETASSVFLFQIKINRAKEYRDMGEDFHHCKLFDSK